MIALVDAKRALRLVALTTAVFFLNLLVGAELARLGDGWGIPSALAQGSERRVAVFILPGADDAAEAASVLNSIIRENTDQLEGVTLVTGVRAEGEGLLAEAERHVDAGMDALGQRNYAPAEQSLAKAHGLIEKALPAVPRRLHARVLKGLGIARFFAGKVDEARDLVKRSLLIFEKQSAAEYDYSLEAKNLYRDVRREIQDMPMGTIEVSSEPAGAAIYLDHYLKGYTSEDGPFKLQNVPAGPHFVRLAKDGYDVWAGYVELEAAGSAQVETELASGPGGARTRTLLSDATAAVKSGRGVPVALKALGSHLNATEVLVAFATTSTEGFELNGWFSPPEGEAFEVSETVVQDATLYQSLRDLTSMTIGGDYEAQEVLALDSPEGAQEVALTPIGAGAEDLVLDPDSPIFKGTRRAQSDPVYKKWWFWTIIGVAAAGVTTGAILLGQSQDTGGGGPTGGVTVQLNQF